MKLLTKIRKFICGKKDSEAVEHREQNEEYDRDSNKGEFLGTLAELNYDLTGFSGCIVDRGYVYRKIDINKN